MVSNREDLQSDCKTVNAIVSALTHHAAGGGGIGCIGGNGGFSGPGSTEEFVHLHHLNPTSLSGIGLLIFQK